MITGGRGLAIIKTVREKKLYVELISPNVVNTTATSIVRPGEMFVVAMSTNIIHIGVIKKVDKFVFRRRTLSIILCIKITKNNRMNVKLRGLLNPVNDSILSLVASRDIS
jgi:hypothetical protein